MLHQARDLSTYTHINGKRQVGNLTNSFLYVNNVVSRKGIVSLFMLPLCLYIGLGLGTDKKDLLRLQCS